MNASKARKIKLIKVREKVYREIAKNPQDLQTLRAFMVKKHLVDSGKKFDKAVEMLKTSGRVILKSEEYSSKHQCEKALDSTKRFAETAIIIE